MHIFRHIVYLLENNVVESRANPVVETQNAVCTLCQETKDTHNFIPQIDIAALIFGHASVAGGGRGRPRVGLPMPK
jgi:hypothetical protein